LHHDLLFFLPVAYWVSFSGPGCGARCVPYYSGSSSDLMIPATLYTKRVEAIKWKLIYCGLPKDRSTNLGLHSKLSRYRAT